MRYLWITCMVNITLSRQWCNRNYKKLTCILVIKAFFVNESKSLQIAIILKKSAITAAEQIAKVKMSTMIARMNDVDKWLKDGQVDEAIPAKNDMIVIQWVLVKCTVWYDFSAWIQPAKKAFTTFTTPTIISIREIRCMLFIFFVTFKKLASFSVKVKFEYLYFFFSYSQEWL